jgi:hypothetical protein
LSVRKKGKVVSLLKSLSTTNENIWAGGGIAPPFFSSALDGGKWSGSHTCCFNPEERAPDIHWIRGRVGPRANVEPVEKRKSLALPGIETWPSIS